MLTGALTRAAGIVLGHREVVIGLVGASDSELRLLMCCEAQKEEAEREDEDKVVLVAGTANFGEAMRDCGVSY